MGADENERVGVLSMAGEGACGGWLPEQGLKEIKMGENKGWGAAAAAQMRAAAAALKVKKNLGLGFF